MTKFSDKVKGLLLVLFVGSVSCIPYGHGGYNKFSKYFKKVIDSNFTLKVNEDQFPHLDKF